MLSNEKPQVRSGFENSTQLILLRANNKLWQSLDVSQNQNRPSIIGSVNNGRSSESCSQASLYERANELQPTTMQNFKQVNLDIETGDHQIEKS